MEILQDDKKEQVLTALKGVVDFIKKYPVVLIGAGGFLVVVGLVFSVLFKKKEQKDVV